DRAAVEVKERLFVEDARASSDGGLPVARRIPREAESRRQILICRILEQRIAQRDRRIVDVAQIRDLSVALFRRGDEFPSQSHVEGKSPVNLKVVLNVRADQVLPVMPFEIRTWLGQLEVARLSGEEVLHAREAQAAAASAVGETIVAEVLEVHAALEMVSARTPIDVVGELVEILGKIAGVVAVGADLGHAGDLERAKRLSRNEGDVGMRIEGIDVLARIGAIDAEARFVENGRRRQVALLEGENLFFVLDEI